MVVNKKMTDIEVVDGIVVDLEVSGREVVNN